MTEQQTQDFIDKVTGVAIRCTDMPLIDFFVPNGVYTYDTVNDIYTMMGEYFLRPNETMGPLEVQLYNGFNSNGLGSHRWKILSQSFIGADQVLDEIEQSIELSEPKKCTCELNSLMRNGCKCGGV